MKQVPS